MPSSCRFPALVFTVAMVALGLLSPSLSLCAQAPPFVPGGQFEVFTDSQLTTSGLTGSYVNQNLAGVASPADWRATQTIAGTRVDPVISFASNDWVGRTALGLTGGTSQDWDAFSVQWDGYVRILVDGTTLQTWSDDCSRMWVDINGDGVFQNTAPELADNHWGAAQSLTLGDATPPLAAGVYRLRIQFAEFAFGNLMHLVGSPAVRIAYLVPSNRVAPPHAVAVLRDMVNAWQGWLCDQTARNLGPASRLRVETNAAGVPIVHVVPLADTDAYLRVDPWSRCIQSAMNAGVPVLTRGQVWLLVPLIHHMPGAPGVIDGSVALGGGGGGDDNGVAMLHSIGIELATGGGLTNLTPYGGVVVPGIGPFPLVDAVSFPWFEGSTISSLVSSYYGAGLHELGHALGLAHDARNDDNFHGNLMFNGLRGMRGALLPDLFPGEDCRLAFASSLVLRNSRYLTPCGPHWAPTGPSTTDRVAPQVSSVTSGTMTPVGGLLAITAQVSDDVRLASVLLAKEGETVEERQINGLSASVTFLTPWFDPGVARTYQVTVYDAAGNRSIASTTVLAMPGTNRAAQPRLRVTPSVVPALGRVLLDASGSFDPEGGGLTYQWDLEGDGNFTAPSLNPTRVQSWSQPWPRLVRVRVTDPLGAVSESAPVAVCVMPASPTPFHQTVGSGTPSCRGPVSLVANSQPAIGNAAFNLAVNDAPPATTGLILLATQPSSSCQPIAGLGPTCYHVLPLSLVDAQPLVTDAGGRCLLPLAIPPIPAWAGIEVVFQTMWAEPGACLLPPPSFSTSNALRLRLF